MIETKKPLSEAELARLERLERSKRNLRGRRAPAVLPSRLARAAAFSPKARGLSDDASMVRVFAVRPWAVVEVRGRELGTRHRDALISLFRLRARRFEVIGSDGKVASAVYRTETTWRDMLLASGVRPHVNNLLVALRVLDELRSVTLRVFMSSWSDYEAAVAKGRLASAGWSDGVIGAIEWDGVSLDSKVTATYGEYVRMAFETRHLVSVNADVYFRCKTDYAKAWWPHIDSQPDHEWIAVETLAELVGRDHRAEDGKKRSRFREDVQRAMDDLVRAGGLSGWACEQVGQGRAKTYRYRYTHALPRQGQLEPPIAPPPAVMQGSGI